MRHPSLPRQHGSSGKTRVQERAISAGWRAATCLQLTLRPRVELPAGLAPAGPLRDRQAERRRALANATNTAIAATPPEHARVFIRLGNSVRPYTRTLRDYVHVSILLLWIHSRQECSRSLFMISRLRVTNWRHCRHAGRSPWKACAPNRSHARLLQTLANEMSCYNQQDNVTGRPFPTELVQTLGSNRLLKHRSPDVR